MSGDLTVDVSQDTENRVTIRPKGEVDIVTMGALRDSIEPFLGPSQTVILDLSEVTFADSTLLNILVKARGTLTESGGSLTLRNPSTAARRLLTTGEMDDMIHDEVDRQNES